METMIYIALIILLSILLRGFLLYVVATLLFIPLTVLNIICVLYKNIRQRGFFKVIDEYFFKGAIDIDRFGNSNFRTLFNVILRTKGGCTFGDEQETISSVLGKNQRDKTLSFVGKGVAWILDHIEKGHCKKSIK